MSDWKPYPNNREIMEHPDGFYIIKDNDLGDDNSSIFCLLCEKIMTSFYDEESFNKFECCDTCASKFIYPRMEDWKEGWRPTKEYVMSKLNS